MSPIISFANPTIAPTASQPESLDSVIRARMSGIQAGQQMPSVAGAIAQGVVQGIDNYQRVESNNLKIATQEQQLQQQTLQTQVKELETAAIMENEEVYMKAKKEELEGAFMELRQKNIDLSNREEISKLSMSPMAQDRRRIFEDPKYAQTLINDPKFAESITGRVYNDFSPQEQQQLRNSLDFSKELDFQRRVQLANMKTGQGVVSALDKQASKALEDLDVQAVIGGYKPEDIPNIKLERVPVGQTDTDIGYKGQASKLPATAKYKVIFDGQVTDYVDEKAAQNIKVIQNAEIAKKRLLAQEVGVATTEPSRPSANVGRAVSPSSEPNLGKGTLMPQGSEVNVLQGLINAGVTKMQPATTEYIKAPMKAIASYIDNSAQYPEYQAQSINQKLKQDNVINLTRGIVKDEFITNPDLQVEYNEDYMRKYNENITKAVEAQMTSRFDFTGATRQRVQELVQPLLAKKPEDVYYAERSPAVIAQVNKQITESIIAKRKALTRPLDKKKAMDNFSTSILK